MLNDDEWGHLVTLSRDIHIGTGNTATVRKLLTSASGLNCDLGLAFSKF